jgi:hypothetical protein
MQPQALQPHSTQQSCGSNTGWADPELTECQLLPPPQPPPQPPQQEESLNQQQFVTWSSV